MWCNCLFRPWLQLLLQQQYSAAQLVATLATAGLQMPALLIALQSLRPTHRLRTPLLRLQTQQRTLNERAPMPLQKSATVAQLRQR